MTVELHLGDCLEVMRGMADGCIDAIVTDLPYGTTACKWDEVIPFAPMWEQVKRVLKPRGVFVTTASQPFTSKLIGSNPDWFRYEWIWRKSRKTGYSNCKNAPMKGHENIVVFSDGTFGNGSINRMTYNPQGLESIRKVMRKNGTDNKNHRPGRKVKSYEYVQTATGYPDTVLDIPSENGVHPTQKPVALYEYLIRTYTNEGDTVLDFTMGSGTTGVACIQTNRNFIGIECDEHFYAIAARRIAEAQMQLALPLGDRISTIVSPVGAIVGVQVESTQI